MKPKSCWMRWLSAGLAGVLQAATGNLLASTANPSATDAIAPALGFGKSAIDETFVEPEPPGVFHTAASGSHQGLENTGIDPLEKPAMNCALRTKTRRQILPFRSVIEHPENARNHLSLLG